MKKVLFLILTFCVSLTIAYAQKEMRLLRFPTINGNTVVFTYAGDLYSVDSKGGTARKLTNDVGTEVFPKFSPDGKYIAFTGQYDGNTEVYLIPAEGGTPKRLTFTPTLGRDDVSDRMGPNNIVTGWKDNKTIVFRTRGWEFNDMKGKLFTVTIDGGDPIQVPLPRGGFNSYSPDGSKLAYNRMFREFRTWKRYRGGQADDVWIYDFKSKKTENITNNPAQDIFPMWSGDKVYFISDRDSRMNLFSYNLTTKETKKLTDFKDFDIKFPSLGDKAIVFENGGYIYSFDLATEKVSKHTISIDVDFVSGRGGLIDVSKNVTNFEISPDGKRGLFGARGEIFTVPVKNGPTRNLTNSSGIHERSSKWSPDGKWIAFISDESGEDEIYIIPQDGSAKATKLTSGGDTYKYGFIWSPDSKKLLWNDKKQRLQFVDIDSKKVTIVDEAEAWEITSFDWSPDSKWISFSKPEVEMMTKIYLYSLESNKSTPITDGWYNSTSPTFSDDGKYLFFTSQRSFSPSYGWTEWNHIYQDMSKIYLVTLSSETKSPFEPKSDEVTIKEKPSEDDKGKSDKPKDDKKSSSDVTVKVDLNGIVNRIIELPISASNYFNLTSAGSKLYYNRNGSKDQKSKLMFYDFEKLAETEVGEFGGFEISFDNKKLLVSQMNSYAIVDLPSAKLEIKDRLNISDMKMTLDRSAEWSQIFNESWRQMRDFLYDPNLHGVDWEKMKKNYSQLLPYVNHRIDLTYIIGEMIGELNIGHAYVGGGDFPKPERIKLGLLGAEVERDASSKFYKITKIYKGENWSKERRSPLTEIGVEAKVGDYITAIDGTPLNKVSDINELLIGKAGKQVTIKVNSAAKLDGSRDNVIVPLEDHSELLYYNWVRENIEKVNKATNGKVGYIHIPDMGPNGLNKFVEFYYPQLRKEALIIDDRGNGGGNVSPMITERLNRQLVMIDKARNGAIGANPGGMHVGPKVLLMDEYSMSDGDIFAYRFKHYKIGPTIGKRSWGGVVGIRGSLPFVDGGSLNRPEFSRYDVEGKEWIMEGYGVDPDILIDNDPALEYEGVDQQLNKAIEVALEQLKKNPSKLPAPPKYPNKSK
ncbi:MAG: PD40 domain-containing protein [Ignavibacteriaceae bacterium]|nr:PD40 domain-containing protein [Ignavibacteriaceae bacterium]